MALLSCPWALDIETIGTTTVVRFTPAAARDDVACYDLGTYLLGLATAGGIVLNLAAVDYLNSLLIGKFFALHKRVKARGGRLILCRVGPAPQDLLALVKLPYLIPLMDTEEEALAALEQAPAPRVARAAPRVAEQPPEAEVLVRSPVAGASRPSWCAS